MHRGSAFGHLITELTKLQIALICEDSNLSNAYNVRSATEKLGGHVINLIADNSFSHLRGPASGLSFQECYSGWKKIYVPRRLWQDKKSKALESGAGTKP